MKRKFDIFVLSYRFFHLLYLVFFFDAFFFSSKPRYTSINNITNLFRAMKSFQIKRRLTEDHLELSQIFKMKFRQNI